MEFVRRATCTVVWVAAISLSTELLSFFSQKWLIVGSLGIVLLILVDREIFMNLLSKVMIRVSRVSNLDWRLWSFQHFFLAYEVVIRYIIVHVRKMLRGSFGLADSCCTRWNQGNSNAFSCCWFWYVPKFMDHGCSLCGRLLHGHA